MFTNVLIAARCSPYPFALIIYKDKHCGNPKITQSRLLVCIFWTKWSQSSVMVWGGLHVTANSTLTVNCQKIKSSERVRHGADAGQHPACSVPE